MAEHQQKKSMKKIAYALTVIFFLVLLGLTLVSRKTSTNSSLKTLNVEAKSGSDVSGYIKVSESLSNEISEDKLSKSKLKIQVSLAGLKPNHLHGFHIHENGDCSSKDAKSAGGHFAPKSHAHGSPKNSTHHIGDLGNLRSNSSGQIKKTISMEDMSISNKSNGVSILNRAFVLHAEKDDFSSQPSGDSGKRIACAVIN